MFSNWIRFSLSTARLGYEVQTVMALRVLKLARKAAETEARRMVAEKGVAFAEAATTLATGGSMSKVVRRVRSRVSSLNQIISLGGATKKAPPGEPDGASRSSAM
jgi:hypothetical protein